MSQIKVDTITDGAGTGAPIFPNGIGAISGQTLFANGTAAAPSITNTGDLNTGILFPAADTVAVTTGGSERMRIDSAGNVLAGTTSKISTGTGAAVHGDTSTAGAVFEIRNASNNATGRDFVRFYNNSSTEAGSIEHNGASTVAYLTSSDYRLKEAVQPMTGALAKVAALKPCTYKWKIDGTHGEGFIAHELQQVVPIAVSGEKDAVDADGKPEYQGVDTSFLVATLTAAIQEQQALITALTARVSALENTAN